MPRKKTTDEMIADAIEVHGDKYDYSLVEYIGTHEKIKVICPIHGEFWVRPNDHITKRSGCPSCYGNKRKTSDQFINEAIEIHGRKYDYSLVEYHGTHKKVNVVCQEHGVFSITPKNHISQKQGCRKCGYERIGDMRRKSLNRFISDANNIHDNQYDYSLVVYNNNLTKVKIRCNKHGVFEQTPDHHLNQKSGCPHCWNERRPPGCGGYSESWFEHNPDQRDIPGLLYVIKMTITETAETFIKIGITKNSIKERYARTGAGDKYIDKEILVVIPTTLFKAYELETKLLGELKEFQYFPNYKFDGLTECVKFSPVVLEKIDETI